MYRILFILFISMIIQMSKSDTTGSSVGSSTASSAPTITATISTSSSASQTTTTTVAPVISTYSNSLTMSSPTFRRPNGLSGYYYYYQAIQVSSTTSAMYALRSNSTMDTYACLYSSSFNPSNPNQNMIICDDDSGGGTQFLIQYYLQWSVSYILVVTTYNPAIIGNYLVVATGPSRVYMTSINPLSSTTARSSTTSATTTTFSGHLSTNSPTFNRPDGSISNYYYQAIQTITYTSGTYTLRSYSTIDTYGCLYLSSFNPSFPQQNKITCDDDSGGSGQFLINYYLQYSSTYILVVTTYTPGITGDYSISATGPGSVYMTSITPVQTIYTGYLSSSNPTFVRPSGTSSNYYYNSIQVNTNTSGTYTFKSSSSTATDLYGCLYIESFDPSYPSSNKLTCDDDSGGSLQFLFTQNLYSYNTYILVVTTFSTYTSGSYSIAVMGPSSVSMRSITPNPNPSSSSLTLIQIIAIIICGVVFVAIISMIIGACRHRQRILLNRQVVSPIQNSPRNAQNIRQVNVVGTPYPTPKPPGYPIIVEEAPPSYQAYVSTLKP